jgi:hypothetical protein
MNCNEWPSADWASAESTKQTCKWLDGGQLQQEKWRLVVLSLLKLGLLRQKVRCAALNGEVKQQMLGPTEHGDGCVAIGSSSASRLVAVNKA